MPHRMTAMETDITTLSVDAIVNAANESLLGGGGGDDGLLRGCYENSLALAAEAGLNSIAFPAISTGVYRFPVPRATAIAVETVAGILRGNADFETVIFCTFGAEVTDAYAAALADYR